MNKALERLPIADCRLLLFQLFHQRRRRRRRRLRAKMIASLMSAAQRFTPSRANFNVDNIPHVAVPDYHRDSYLSLGDTELDAYLQPALCIGRGILEVAGNSGAGKTQFCLQLAVQLLLSDPLAHVVYFCCEAQFPIARFHGLLNCRTSDPSFLEAAMQRVLIEHLFDVDSLQHSICYKLPALCQRLRDQHPACTILIVIDSIAANFRYGPEKVQRILDGATPMLTVLDTTRDGQSDNAEPKEFRLYAHFKYLWEIALKLKKLSRDQTSVLCTNQVTGNASTPALGAKWTRNLTSRIMLNSELSVYGDDQLTITQRTACLVLSPENNLQNYATTRFQITSNGLCSS